MRTINISLPDKLAEQLDVQATFRGFASRSEFFRSLLRRYLEEEKETKFPLPVIVYKKKSLDQVKREMDATGKYNKKFVDSVVKGLARSSTYAGKKA